MHCKFTRLGSKFSSSRKSGTDLQDFFIAKLAVGDQKNYLSKFCSRFRVACHIYKSIYPKPTLVKSQHRPHIGGPLPIFYLKFCFRLAM
jgi:hypothetical protein